MRSRRLRYSAMTLAVYFFLTTVFPPQMLALTGGPSQPEVQSFEPIGTSDMVDLFSGDFVYNIPLLDVEGYPINLAYHSGVSMDQEASWVGLGWNVNVGAVNRAKRGIPDDFAGDKIEKEFSRKPNETYGITFGADLELFGIENLAPTGTAPGGASGFDLSVGATLGMTFNNYNGVGATVGLSGSYGIPLDAGAKGSLTGSLGLTSSSDGGLTIQPSLSYATKNKQGKDGNYRYGGTLGTAFNSRIGLQQLSVGGNVQSGDFANATNRKQRGSMNASFDLMQPTYVPTVGDPVQSYTLKGRFKNGASFFGFDGGWSIDGYYSRQDLLTNYQAKPSYGYMHTEGGQDLEDVILDFNRENDGPFTAQTPALPLTNYTYDIFSVSGQGNGGSFRPFRSAVSYVHDGREGTISNSASVGVELSPGGNAYHVGVNLGTVTTNSTSGTWEDENNAADFNKYVSTNPYKDYERFYMKEASEKSVSVETNHLESVGGNRAVRYDVQEISKFNTHLRNTLEDDNGFSQNYTDNTLDQRERRNSTMQFLSQREVVGGLGLNDAVATNPNIKDHHIAEVTTLGPEGSRYVYGLPAYNNKQRDVTFAVGTENDNDLALNLSTDRCSDGTIVYDPTSDNTLQNEKGKDNYFEATTTPGYAHSYMLTAIISPDYVDVDNIKGPSVGDLGTWTKFSYQKPGEIDPGQSHDFYRWRVPYNANEAQYNEGLRSVATDDKANYSYGEKELWYLDKIETKNFVALFEKEVRQDACGVVGENGGIDVNNNMFSLKKITLYARPDFEANGANATPIKEVHFVYDYSLCPGIDNNSAGQGKLTLKEVFFTYRGSKQGQLSPYKFSYADVDHDGIQDANFPYNLTGYDRWGHYKPNPSTSCDLNDPLAPNHFPYVDQTDADQQARYMAAWSLTKIELPSGGTIEVDYESDDYSYVQNKKAMQMARIVGISDNAGALDVGGTNIDDFDILSISDDDEKNRWVYVELPDGTTDAAPYFDGIDNLYFRALTEFKNNGVSVQDYVSGYCQLTNDITTVTAFGKTLARVKLKAVSLKDSGSEDYNPIAAAGVQFGRLHLSSIVWDDSNINSASNGFFDVLDAMVGAFAGFKTGFQNPNKSRWNKGQGTSIVMNKSWVRLNNVNGHKLGGGCRVKSLRMSDQWETMVGSGAGDSFEYGQEYSYTNEDGTSSGIAAYEPQLGGDENPWKQPVQYASVKRWAPDDRFYAETPFGESFFPSASVGYGRVVVKNLQRGVDGNGDGTIDDSERTVTKHATGEVQHEFYTAKDFPTIVGRTEVEADRDKTSPFSITSLLSIHSKDYMTASQGFVIECNDMHGKPKAQRVYQEDKTDPITSVEYYYQEEGYSTSSKRLTNDVVAISSDGSVNNQAQIGVFFDMVADFREQESTTISPNLGLNSDGFFLGPVFIPAFVPVPGISVDKTRFRSSSVTKVIQRFGVLERTVAKDLGSVVETKNLAYDAETGEVLLTETTTDFNDKIYTMNYPAYWHYDGMGPAYKNIDFATGQLVSQELSFSSGVATYADADQYFAEGDEVAVMENNNIPLTSVLLPVNYVRGWVTEVGPNSIEVQLYDGTLLSGNRSLKVLRSGRRNQQMQSMASITTRTNPLSSLQTNIYENIIQASAIEFDDSWRTYCECFEASNGGVASTNPYVQGIKGNYRPKTSYLHLSDRTQANYNDNTNIREDGYFTSYRPFYKWTGSEWEIDREDWTFTAEVTEFNPFGQELENQDALGRYSAATFGFNQTLATSVAANSRYHEIGFDSFEDYPFSPCADEHFKVDPAFRSTAITNETAHTGFHSLKVSSGTPVTIGKIIDDWCDETVPCSSLALDVIPGPENLTVKAKGGVPVYSYQYDVISGAPNINYDPFNGLINIAVVGGQLTFSVEIEVTDAEGCVYSEIINVVNGVIQ